MFFFFFLKKALTNAVGCCKITHVAKRGGCESGKYAGLAHLVERHLAKVEVASSSLVTRSIFSYLALAP